MSALQAVRTLLAIPPSRVFISRLERHRRTKPVSQKGGGKDKIFEVQELNCRFLVNLTGRPGTDLPLALRNIRLMIGRLSPGKTFLNLFGGTGRQQSMPLSTTPLRPPPLMLSALPCSAPGPTLP